MKWGDLRDHFKAIALKRLSSHEVDPTVSNGHEFQGVNGLRDVLGSSERRGIPATYVLLSDDEGDRDVVRATASWYDARANQPKRSSEWRLYYPKEAAAIQAKMTVGDLMVITVSNDDTLGLLLAQQESRAEAQLLRLFGSDENDRHFHVRRFDDDSKLDFVAATILEDLGLGTASLPADGDSVDRLARALIQEYPDALPAGRIISAKVHDFVAADPVADPDGALMMWIETETAAFRLWEDALIARTLKRGFVLPGGYPDVDDFRAFTMRLRQSRVSRAGGALQIHTARILNAHSLLFEEQVETENGERPDFVLPSAAAYHDPATPADRLAMIATKHTLKDRWRQVLAEAKRIPTKNLLTMDAAVTLPTLASLAASGIRTVVPSAVRQGYKESARNQLVSLEALMHSLREMQAGP